MKNRAALLMLLPATGFFLLSFVAPMVIAGRLSFTDGKVWVGLANYIKAGTDGYFQKAFVNSFIFVGLIAPAQVFFAYMAASLISRFDRRVQTGARFAVYVPGLASGVVMSLLWRWILDKEGLINGLLRMLGLPIVRWLTEVWPSRFGLALIVWLGGLGGLTIMLSATMQQIPKELRDASRVDGATDGQYRRLVVFPFMIPTVLLCALLSIVGMMTIWETIYMMWNGGGPEGGIATPVYEIFMTAFMFGKQPLAAAKGIILMVVIALILWLKGRIERWARL